MGGSNRESPATFGFQVRGRADPSSELTRFFSEVQQPGVHRGDGAVAFLCGSDTTLLSGAVSCTAPAPLVQLVREKPTSQRQTEPSKEETFSHVRSIEPRFSEEELEL